PPITAPDLELTLANTGATPFSSLFDDEPPESVPVTLYQYFKGLPWDCAEVIFQGYVREVMEYNSLTCTLLIQGLWAKYDRLIGRDLAITRDAFANADPDAIGKMQPLVYGAVDNLPCLAVKAGAMSNLPGDITDSVTSIELSDASVFPASGTVQIDTEQITYPPIDMMGPLSRWIRQNVEIRHAGRVDSVARALNLAAREPGAALCWE
ncbi:MAG: hypothetical protein JEZ02_18640, partial [Desulfatibacillum sp.]|nr:hypothetical protein [Desulfatibacillum sp.]